MHILTLASTTVILIMAANTSFADFPRLGALHAEDGFLPRQLTYRGRRLVFSWGIILLAIVSSLLVIIFNARVNALIPLYAIGVFLSFTMSQVGMVVRWSKVGRLKPGERVDTKGIHLEYDPKWHVKMGINALGAVVSFVVMVIQTVTKFTNGAWIVVVLIPFMVWIFFSIHSHYKSVAAQLSLRNPIPPLPKDKTVIILVGGVHQGTLKAINMARMLNPNHLHAVHIATHDSEVEVVKNKWAKYAPDISIESISSPFRDLTGPLVDYIKKVEEKWEDDTIIVVMPQLVPTKFWHHFLHGQTGIQIRWALEHLENVEILDVPYLLYEKPVDN